MVHLPSAEEFDALQPCHNVKLKKLTDKQKAAREQLGWVQTTLPIIRFQRGRCDRIKAAHPDMKLPWSREGKVTRVVFGVNETQTAVFPIIMIMNEDGKERNHIDTAKRWNAMSINYVQGRPLDAPISEDVYADRSIPPYFSMMKIQYRRFQNRVWSWEWIPMRDFFQSSSLYFPMVKMGTHGDQKQKWMRMEDDLSDEDGILEGGILEGGNTTLDKWVRDGVQDEIGAIDRVDKTDTIDMTGPLLPLSPILGTGDERDAIRPLSPLSPVAPSFLTDKFFTDIHIDKMMKSPKMPPISTDANKVKEIDESQSPELTLSPLLPSEWPLGIGRTPELEKKFKSLLLSNDQKRHLKQLEWIDLNRPPVRFTRSNSKGIPGRTDVKMPWKIDGICVGVDFYERRNILYPLLIIQCDDGRHRGHKDAIIRWTEMAINYVRQRPLDTPISEVYGDKKLIPAHYSRVLSIKIDGEWMGLTAFLRSSSVNFKLYDNDDEEQDQTSSKPKRKESPKETFGGFRIKQIEQHSKKKGKKNEKTKKRQRSVSSRQKENKVKKAKVVNQVVQNNDLGNLQPPDTIHNSEQKIVTIQGVQYRWVLQPIS